jgi:pimeloyl-ACP methyl ester carboxylesterase
MDAVDKESGFFKSFDDTEIYYEVRGEGEPIVFVYGIACLMNHYRPQIQFFSRHYKVITFDLRGHHKSVRPIDNANLNIKSLARDLKFLLEHLKIKKAHFVGHSFGAPVILEGYFQHAEIFKSITLINGFAKNPIKNMFGLDVVEPFFHFFKAQYDQAPDAWSYVWQQAVNNPLAIQLSALAGGFNIKLTSLKDIEIYAKGVAHMDLDVFLTLFADMMSFDATSELSRIKVPTLIISGEKDNVTPPSFQEDFKNLVPNCEFMQVPYGSHCTQLDFPDYVNLRLDKFLSSQK